MGNRGHLVHGLGAGVVLVLAGCEQRAPHGGVDDPLPGICVDADGDQFGEGPGCRGPDCLEGDPSAHVCGCDPEVPSEGCGCEVAEGPLPCFDGPLEAVGVADCVGGLRLCRELGSRSYWSACDGQVVPRDEVCNAADDDCDGDIDEGLDACRSCGPECDVVGWGAGLEPFTADDPGLEVTADGRLAWTGVSPGPRWIWVPDTLAGTISKVDTRALLELARYRTGPLGASASAVAGPGDVPVAVAVAPRGDAVVVNRSPTGLPSATRIRSGDCLPGVDGEVDTSGGSDVLPWPEEGPSDDCIAWSTPFADASARGTLVLYDARPGLDGTVVERVWAGAESGLVQLDFEDGSPTGVFWPLPIEPMTGAIDAHGDPWILGPGAHELVRVDADNGDFQGVALPLGEDAQALWIDERGDVWTAGEHVVRYRPAADEFDVAGDSEPSDGGIVVDAAGVAWVASSGGAIQRVEVQAGALLSHVLDDGFAGDGIAVDHDGAVFVLAATPGVGLGRIDPREVEDGAVPCCDFLGGSLARGDFTGAPRFDGLDAVTWTGRLAPPPNDCPTTFGDLDVRGQHLEEVELRVEIRVALTLDALDEAPWILLAEVPDDELPASVGAVLDGGESAGALELRLTVDPVDADELPVIDEITVERSTWCF